MNIQLSKVLFEKAKKYIPGGVNSPVRAFKAVGGIPRFIERAKGPKIYDIDGNSYIDYVCSWGALILGHADSTIVSAVKDVIEKGTSFGTPTSLEVRLAELIVEVVPGIEQVRLVTSGTEAVMSAIRLARSYTGKKRIIKFEGCYHGHTDSMLVKAGSGASTFGIPDSLGVIPEITKYTTVVPFNDIDAVTHVMDNNVAAIIVEPICGNMGVILPQEEFLTGLRDITSKYGSLLIFDEVITGFRVGCGGAQELYNITPDITCLGKIIGGGFPVGAYGGMRDIMKHVAPAGNMYQAGTLSGNPVAVQAGLATLKILVSTSGIYELLENNTNKLCKGLYHVAKEEGIDIVINQIGSMFSIFFSKVTPTNYQTAKMADTHKYAIFFNEMLNGGIYLPPSQFEACFVSLAHALSEIEYTIEAAHKAFKHLQKMNCD
jgi:glutamate-1-semialdehyde 2,1-aminomutase